MPLLSNSFNDAMIFKLYDLSNGSVGGDNPLYWLSCLHVQQIMRPTLCPQVVTLKGEENFHEWARTLKSTLSFDLEDVLTVESDDPKVNKKVLTMISRSVDQKFLYVIDESSSPVDAISCLKNLLTV